MAVRFMSFDNAIPAEVQANGGATDASSGGPGASFMRKLGSWMSALRRTGGAAECRTLAGRRLVELRGD